jgi:hypothetical protein
MKQILLTVFFLTGLIFSQLRVGVDMSSTHSIEMLGISSDDKIDGVGFTLGYEQMLLSLVGVGGELTLGGDYMDRIQGYAVAKIPVGLPMFRGIVRVGYSKIMGDWEEIYDGGLSYGFGVRFKMPVIPIGVEALYSIHSLEDKDSEDDEMGLGKALGLEEKSKIINITATYSF